MAEISSSVVHAAPLSPPPESPAAEGHGGGAADDKDDEHNDDDDDDGNNNFSPLLDLVERFPDLFAQKLLQHLDPIDRTFLAQTGVACRTVVAASDLPRAGTRWMVMGTYEWAQAQGVLHVRRAAGVGQGERLPVGCHDVHAPLRRAGVWMCCGGRRSKGARGTILLAHAPLRAGTCMCCSGRGSTAAGGARIL